MITRPTTDKIEKIIKILEKVGKRGIWIRELSRQTKMPVSTIHYYLNKYLEDRIEIQNVKIGEFSHKQMKLIKLK
jgi:predicted transcriptional regulator